MNLVRAILWTLTFLRHSSLSVSFLLPTKSITNNNKIKHVPFPHMKHPQITTLSPAHILSSSSSSSSPSNKPTHVPVHLSRSVLALLLSAFFNLLGFTMAGPITPALGSHFSLPTASASFGSLTSAYPLGMLVGLFLWPSLSDRIGRKPVIVASLLGSGVGLAMQSMVIVKGGRWGRRSGLLWFLAVRVLTGSFAGSSPVSKAYLADVGAKSGRLPQFLAWRDAASTLAFVVGPLLGGVFYDCLGGNVGSNLGFVIGLSAAASFLAAALVALFVDETGMKNKTRLKKKTRLTTMKNKNIAHANPAANNIDDIPDQDADDIVSCPLGAAMWSGVATVCVVSFLFNVGDSTFHAFSSALLRDGLGFTTKNIGLFYTVLACVSFTVSTTLSGKIIKTFGPVRACMMGLSTVGSGLTILAASKGESFRFILGAASLYYAGVSMYGPTVPTMLLRCVPRYQRGTVMGLDGAINTVARVISPLIMGEVFRRFGSGPVFYLAGSLTFLGALIALLRRLLVLRQLRVGSSSSSASVGNGNGNGNGVDPIRA